MSAWWVVQVPVITFFQPAHQLEPHPHDHTQLCSGVFFVVPFSSGTPALRSEQQGREQGVRPIMMLGDRAWGGAAACEMPSRPPGSQAGHLAACGCSPEVLTAHLWRFVCGHNWTPDRTPATDTPQMTQKQHPVSHNQNTCRHQPSMLAHPNCLWPHI